MGNIGELLDPAIPETHVWAFHLFKPISFVIHNFMTVTYFSNKKLCRITGNLESNS